MNTHSIADFIEALFFFSFSGCYASEIRMKSSEMMWTSALLGGEVCGQHAGCDGVGCSRTTCIHVVGPTAGLGAAAGRRGAARVEDIVHRAVHLAVVNGLALVGAEGEK